MGPAIMAAGKGFEMYSDWQESSAKQKMQDMETRRLKQEAKSVEAATAFKQQRAAGEGARELSSMEAAAAAGGAVSTTGAPLMAMAKQSAENELKNLMIGHEGAEQASALRYEADLSKYKSKLIGHQKRMKLMGQLIGAGGTAMSGFPVAPAGGASGQAIGGADPSYVASPEFESLSGRYGTFM